MPIEIRELVIRAEVNEPAQRQERPSGGENLADLKQEIVSECVEKVMEIIHRKNER
jgi:hypothetical protein